MKKGNQKIIGIFHYKVGGTDGVSLEIEKWQLVLEKMGHIVHLCAGDLGGVPGTLIEEMHHHSPDAKRLTYNTFTRLADYPDEAAYRKDLFSLAEKLKVEIRGFIRDKRIDFLIPQNIWSVALNPPLAIALTQVMRELEIPALAQSHDFYWERTNDTVSCKTAADFADEYLPPRDNLARHVVINRLAQKELSRRKNINSVVIPNVFDFNGGGDDAGHWQPDEYNRDFKAAIGLEENDLYILQATRIVPRKGIELAIDLVKALGNPKRREILEQRGLYDGRPFLKQNRVVLVLAGYSQDDFSGQYLQRLKDKIKECGVDAVFIEDRVGARRGIRNGKKIYSLWDSYVYADLVTYPSLWEGWGNQFLEGLRAKKSIVLFEYPVYRSDIKDKGFSVISLGSEFEKQESTGLAQISEETVERAADQAIECLTNPEARQAMVERNYNLGCEYFSLASLERYLGPLFNSQEN